jgi:hypothetical protein
MDKQGDPTSPSKIKGAVMNYVENSFNNGVSIEEGQVKLNILSSIDLGYPEGPDRTETDKVKLFYFYLEGVIGEFAFIGKEVYDRFNPDRKGNIVGRFGEGFLIPMDVYSKRKRNHLIDLPSESDVRFPLSGAHPINLIGLVMAKMDMNKYTKIAFNRAMGNEV